MLVSFVFCISILLLILVVSVLLCVCLPVMFLLFCFYNIVDFGCFCIVLYLFIRSGFVYLFYFHIIIDFGCFCVVLCCIVYLRRNFCFLRSCISTVFFFLPLRC
jgi:hypothetical protein